MSDVPPVPPPWADPHEALRNKIDEARCLARSYCNGLIQKEPIDARRVWAGKVAQMLDYLADALTRLLPEEGLSRMYSRVAARNERQRAERGDPDKLEFPKLQREDKTNLH